MRITFAGAAGTVTGSRYLLELGEHRLLIDCGLFQGIKALRERNWAPLPFSPQSLDAVLLTHAHIDHSGYLPRLKLAGYRRSIYCTPGTRDLLGILLPDSGYLQEEEARHANKHGYAHHAPALPLYTREEAEAVLPQLEPIEFDREFEVLAGVRARFTRAGHILGSACLTISYQGRSVTFSGDVGRPCDPILKPPAKLPACDQLILESTYGDRRHPQEDVPSVLAQLINTTAQRGGTLVVPAFAVGRAQHLLHLLSELRREGKIPALPIHLDSPMAISATDIFARYPEEHRLDAEALARMQSVASFAHTPDQSKAIDACTSPQIVISASGMATGGRILHHLRRFLPDPANTVLLVGYQSSGTRGRTLLDGADELKIHGQYVRVRAQIARLDALSAHADYAELIAWLRESAIAPRRVFITHGEPAASDALRRRVRDELGWNVVVPTLGEAFDL
ncbi:MAG TPA: MBL fold metallo-hydrolase [Polyangiales bacterium]